MIDNGRMIIKAAFLEKPGQPLVIAEGIETPNLASGQILVKIAYSGVCHSQLMEANGKRGEDHYLPHMLGHEGSGTVLEIGEGVSKVEVGDQVVLGWIKGQGLDGGGCKYTHGTRKINAGGVTTFMTHAVVSENRCVKLPAGIPLDIAVLFGCAVPTGAGIVLNTIQPHEGSAIVVWGLGGIGLCALMATQAFKCRQVIAVDIEASKLELAKEIGATHVVKSGSDKAIEEIMAISGGGVDYSVESAGRISTIESAFAVLKRSQSLCVFASHPPQGQLIKLDPFALICGKKIMGSWGGDSAPDRDIPKYASLYRAGKFPLEKLLSKRYSLENINDALDDLANRKIARALLAIDPAE